MQNTSVLLTEIQLGDEYALDLDMRVIFGEIYDKIICGMKPHGAEKDADYWFDLRMEYENLVTMEKYYKLFVIFRNPEHAMLAQLKGLTVL